MGWVVSGWIIRLSNVIIVGQDIKVGQDKKDEQDTERCVAWTILRGLLTN